MKKIFYIVLMLAGMLALVPSNLVASSDANGDLYILSTPNGGDKTELPAKIVEQLKKDGFTISADTDMTKPFKIQFKTSDFDVFHLTTIFHNELSPKLVKKIPHAGIFSPMGVGIYQRKGDSELHVSILRAKAQAKILGLDKVDPILSEIEKKLLSSLKSTMPNAKVTIDTNNPLPAEGKLLSIHKLEIDADELDDAKDDLIMTLEADFKPVGFVVAAHNEYNKVLTKNGTIDSPFDFYDTYSICKLKVIYTVAKTRPEASAFAPCSMMLYKKKGDDEIVMGFPSVYNWMSSAHVTDEAAKKELIKAQTDFEDILIEATE